MVNKKDNIAIDLSTIDPSKLFNGEIANKIKLRCPTMKFPLNPEDKFHVIGMSMMLEQDLENTLKLDLEDLDDDTIICIDNHQLLEAVGIIDGALRLIESNGISIDIVKQYGNSFIPTTINRKRYLNTLLVDLTKYRVVRYEHFKEILKDHLYLSPGTEGGTKQKCVQRLNFIISNIWFVTYNDLDAFYEKTINQFKNVAEGKKNENNG